MANFNINKAIVGGRLTDTPELKLTPSGVYVTSFTIATSSRYKKEEPVTDFINCIAWRTQAEIITNHFRKGSSICVLGKIKPRSWTTPDGEKRYATEVIVDEVIFVDSKNENRTATIDTPQFTPPQEDTAFSEITDDDLPF